jgi:hypothetical protein
MLLLRCLGKSSGKAWESGGDNDARPVDGERSGDQQIRVGPWRWKSLLGPVKEMKASVCREPESGGLRRCDRHVLASTVACGT